jgi:hypothetical protein
MKRADAAFGVHVRARGVCESDRPNHAGNLQCAHIISRSYRVIRTDPRNALALCQGCHTYYTHRPLEWREFIDRTYPGLWDELTGLALTYVKVDWKAQAECWEAKNLPRRQGPLPMRR